MSLGFISNLNNIDFGGGGEYMTKIMVGKVWVQCPVTLDPLGL